MTIDEMLTKYGTDSISILVDNVLDSYLICDPDPNSADQARITVIREMTDDLRATLRSYDAAKLQGRAHAYLLAMLDSKWEENIDYAQSADELRADWEDQNAVRVVHGFPTLTDEDLALATNKVPQ